MLVPCCKQRSRRARSTARTQHSSACTHPGQPRVLRQSAGVVDHLPHELPGGCLVRRHLQRHGRLGAGVRALLALEAQDVLQRLAEGRTRQRRAADHHLCSVRALQRQVELRGRRGASRWARGLRCWGGCVVGGRHRDRSEVGGAAAERVRVCVCACRSSRRFAAVCGGEAPAHPAHGALALLLVKAPSCLAADAAENTTAQVTGYTSRRGWTATRRRSTHVARDSSGPCPRTHLIISRARRLPRACGPRT